MTTKRRDNGVRKPSMDAKISGKTLYKIISKYFPANNF